MAVSPWPSHLLPRASTAVGMSGSCWVGGRQFVWYNSRDHVRGGGPAPRAASSPLALKRGQPFEQTRAGEPRIKHETTTRIDQRFLPGKAGTRGALSFSCTVPPKAPTSPNSHVEGPPAGATGHRLWSTSCFMQGPVARPCPGRAAGVFAPRGQQEMLIAVDG